MSLVSEAVRPRILIAEDDPMVLELITTASNSRVSRPIRRAMAAKRSTALVKFALTAWCSTSTCRSWMVFRCFRI